MCEQAAYTSVQPAPASVQYNTTAGEQLLAAVLKEDAPADGATPADQSTASTVLEQFLCL